MKIAIRRGHNKQAIGSVGLVSEVVENENILIPTIKYLRALGHEVLDVSPSNMNQDADLVYGVKKANEWGADLFVSIHNNKAYASYQGSIGAECWVYSKADKFNDEDYAQRIVNSISSLGFKNRGVKESKTLYELKNTKMPAVIVECFFVEATEDVALYKKVGADALGKAIAEGISNKKVNSSAQVVAKPVATTTNESLYRVRKSWDNPKSQLGAYKTLDNAKKNCPGGYYVFDCNGKTIYPVVQNSTSVIPNKGKCTITVKEGIIFRDKPSVSVGIRQGVYNYKESVNYDSKMETDKYTWISWIGASTGTRRYMPVVDKTTGEKWGSFA